MGELARRVGDFEQINPVASHAAQVEYLENLEALLRSAAIMFRQDGQIAGTWIRKRRPLTGAMKHLRERIAFGHRTKAHGKHGSKALIKAADKVAKQAKLHRQFMAEEENAKHAARARAEREKKRGR